MRTALNVIGTTQAQPTECTYEECKHILDNAATCPNLVIRCCASDVTLHIDSDAAYLVLPNAKSRIARFFYSSSPLLDTDGPMHDTHFATLCLQQPKRKHQEYLLIHNWYFLLDMLLNA